MVQNPNQFAMTPEKGQLTLDHNWNTLNCVVSETETGELVAGQAVVIVDEAGSQIPVAAATAADDAIFGFVPYNVRTDSYEAGEQIKVAKNGDVMRMQASAAIARGAELQIVPTGNLVVTASTGTVIGQALDKATAANQLIRVLITV